MASAPTLSANPNPVPFGGSSTITVGFTLAPGGAYDVKLFQDGVEKAAGSITFQGESAPAVQAGSTNQGWEIRSSAGTLSPLGGNKFSLVA